jgi:uncharacterized DUF497 family protein
MRDDDFEWDDRKAARNLAKHNVAFSVAREVFEDPNVVEWEDDGHGDAEQRFVAIGVADRRLLQVSYTFRGRRTRIISARLAESWERRRYLNGG